MRYFFLLMWLIDTLHLLTPRAGPFPFFLTAYFDKKCRLFYCHISLKLRRIFPKVRCLSLYYLMYMRERCGFLLDRCVTFPTQPIYENNIIFRAVIWKLSCCNLWLWDHGPMNVKYRHIVKLYRFIETLHK